MNEKWLEKARVKLTDEGESTFGSSQEFRKSEGTRNRDFTVYMKDITSNII